MFVPWKELTSVWPLIWGIEPGDSRVGLVDLYWLFWLCWPKHLWDLQLLFFRKRLRCLSWVPGTSVFLLFTEEMHVRRQTCFLPASVTISIGAPVSGCGGMRLASACRLVRESHTATLYLRVHAILAYIVCFRLARATHNKTVSQKNKEFMVQIRI